MRDLDDLPIAIIQTTLVWQTPEANRLLFDKLLAKVEEAELIILPEMFSTGFTMEAEKMAEREDGKTVQWLKNWAKKLNTVVTGSLIIQSNGGAYYNRLYWVRPDGTMAHYDKRHLFRMANEQKHYTAGEHQLLIEYKGWKIRPLICYDLRFPVWSRDPHNTDILIYVANWPKARRDQWSRLLSARAIENMCYCIGVNRVGQDGQGIEYGGDSQVFNYLGDPLLEIENDQGIFHCTLSAKELQTFKTQFPAYKDADLFEIK